MKLRNRMKQKDLAEEYLIKAKENAIRFKDGKFPNMPLYQENDIKAAFEAGYDSVFEGLRLLFKETQSGLAAVAKPLDEVYHVYKSASVEEPRYTFAFRYEAPIKWYDTLEEAMDAANDDYRERIKRALGL